MSIFYFAECNSSHPLRCEDKLGCIADYNYCDGKFDCSDRSDEAPSKCPHTGDYFEFEIEFELH